MDTLDHESCFDAPAGFFRQGLYQLEWNATFRVACRPAPEMAASSGEAFGPEIVLVPEAEGGPLPRLGEHVRVRSAEDPALSLGGTVLDVAPARVRIELRPDPGSRRSYFRMRVRLSLLLEGIDRGPRVLARVEELSGGGCRLVVPEGELEVGETRRAHLRLEDGSSPMPVRVEVLRVEPSPDGEEVACAFLDVREHERQRILRRLFREYRRLRRPPSGSRPPESP